MLACLSSTHCQRSLSTKGSFLCPAFLGGRFQNVFKDGICMSVAPTPYKVINSLSEVAGQVVLRRLVNFKNWSTSVGNLMIAFETLYDINEPSKVGSHWNYNSNKAMEK